MNAGDYLMKTRIAFVKKRMMNVPHHKEMNEVYSTMNKSPQLNWH
jgi:hypothetical protein